MECRIDRSRSRALIGQRALSVFCAALLISMQTGALQAQGTATPDTTRAAPAAKIPPEQIESLVAPIALYPDPLLAQTLAAATYPLEVVQLHQFLEKHPNLKDQALADSVAMQPWEASVQSMAAIPDVVKRLADDIQWTTELGNAFLAQQGDVMDAVQRMRKKAKDKGALESNEHQKVETQVVEEKTVIIVEPSNPEVIYVPSYSPTVVYGPPVYPYPPIYYPYYAPGAAFVSFGFGMMWGAAMWGGSCCGCGWGGNNIYINNNNNFVNIDRGDRGDLGDRGDRGGDRGRGDGGRGDGGRGGDRGGNWSHKPEHRGGTPYGDRGTADKFGGSARGDARGNRGPSASQQPAGAGNRGGSAGVSDRAGRGGAGSSAGVSDRAAGTGGTGNRGGSAGVSDRSAGSRGSSSGDRIGSQNIPKSSGSKSAFSGGSRGYSERSARSSSSRGSQSMGSRGGSRGGGGGSRGGGGRGGGRR